MTIIAWVLITVLFVLAFVGLIYPIIPSSVFLIAGYLIYGWMFSFEPLTWVFWVIQGILVILLYVTDYASNFYGVKKRGGSKHAIWGSTIGLLVGPFIIPVIGILIGPFVGAIVGELLHQKGDFKQAVRVGIGSLLGFIGGTTVKLIIQAGMVIYFLVKVL